VGQKGEYQVAPVGSRRYTIQAKKRGAQFDISWESLVNDGLGAFADIPQNFADAAINTEAWLVTSLYAAAGGPNAALFGAPIDGITNTGVLALTPANLEITLGLAALQTDPITGMPLGVRMKHLVVPPALEITARTTLTSALKQWTEVGGGAGVPMPTTSVLPQMGIQLHVDPMLPIVDVSGNRNGTWYLFADRAQGDAIEFDYLRGHETPEICMKASNKVTAAGANLSPFSGDFETDNIFYRCRIACGGTQLDPRFAYVQVHT
jgi:hypothetical protein